MQYDQIVSSDKEVLDGTPVFSGTRVPIDSLIVHLSAGDSLGQFLADFPSVNRNQAKSFLELMGQRAMDEAGHARPAG